LNKGFQFQALHRVPIFLFFHDADDDFPAQRMLWFWKYATIYLDMRCPAMIDGPLVNRFREGFSLEAIAT
jgi:hypothetical protein